MLKKGLKIVVLHVIGVILAINHESFLHVSRMTANDFSSSPFRVMRNVVTWVNKKSNVEGVVF